jgi:hypothetical protein
MGQITIEVPQRIKRSYRIRDRAAAEKLLADLEKSKTAAKNEKLSAEDLEDIREARKALAEYERTGESYSFEEVRKKLNL